MGRLNGDPDRAVPIRPPPARPAGVVRLIVDDNGPGVPEAHRERVFGLFERLERGAEGTGVGLALVRRIADVHAGAVWVETAPGGGARFVIELPVGGPPPPDPGLAMKDDE